uniref:Uncharacterized protein n=1 Tax=Arundo donax TaxID=35708 RepID=A0A0A9GCI5_ARUDO
MASLEISSSNPTNANMRVIMAAPFTPLELEPTSLLATKIPTGTKNNPPIAVVGTLLDRETDFPLLRKWWTFKLSATGANRNPASADRTADIKKRVCQVKRVQR